MWREPKTLGDKVRIINADSKYCGQIGRIFRTRISDAAVLVYFKVTASKGNVQCFQWKECERV